MSDSDHRLPLFTSIPRGFYTAHEVLNSLTPIVLSQLISFSLHTLSGDSRSTLPLDLTHIATISHLPESSIQSALNALHYIIRALRKTATANPGADSTAKFTTETLTAAFQSETGLSPSAITLILQLFQEHQTHLTSSSFTSTASRLSALRTSLHLNELVDLEWKLGVSVSSSSCSQLYDPYVTLVWKLKDAGGKGGVRVESMELSIKEFRELSGAFHDIAVTLDTI